MIQTTSEGTNFTQQKDNGASQPTANQTKTVPQVFISYSHDSPTHKQWVAELASRLRRDGVDAILDQWDLRRGGDITQFMERGLAAADRVLVICTEEYVRKADAGAGGVGYERMIVTAELVNNVGTDKFIPVIRQEVGAKKMPRFLGARYYVDLSTEDEYEQNYQELLRELHEVPATVKPPLGKNPFATLPSGREAPITVGQQTTLPKLPENVKELGEIYSMAVELARQGDVAGWRQLVKRIRGSLDEPLVAWREHYERNQPQGKDDWRVALDKAVELVAPLFCLALAGVESGREQFRDQRAVVDMVLSAGKQDRGGLVRLIEMPRSLIYLYQAMHGAVCLDTNQLSVAVNLVDTNVMTGHNQRGMMPIRSQHDLIGWPILPEQDCIVAWEYLTGAVKRWSWLGELFGNERNYLVALCAYYMALNVHELAAYIADGKGEVMIQPGHLSLDIPMSFVFMDYDTTTAAFSMLRRQSNLNMLWKSVGTEKGQMRKFWPAWIEECKRWISSIPRGFFVARQLPHEGLF